LFCIHSLNLHYKRSLKTCASLGNVALLTALTIYYDLQVSALKLVLT